VGVGKFRIYRILKGGIDTSPVEKEIFSTSFFMKKLLLVHM